MLFKNNKRPKPKFKQVYIKIPQNKISYIFLKLNTNAPNTFEKKMYLKAEKAKNVRKIWLYFTVLLHFNLFPVEVVANKQLHTPSLPKSATTYYKPQQRYHIWLFLQLPTQKEISKLLYVSTNNFLRQKNLTLN